MIQQTSQPITFEAFYTAAKQGKTGLTVTVDVRDPAGTVIVTAGAATETGGGFYRYTLAGGSTGTGGAYRAIFKTLDTSVDLQHVPSLWEIGVAGVDSLALVPPIKAKTDNLPAAPAATGDAMTLTTGERTSISTAVWSSTTRSLTTFGTLVSDTATAVWAAGARTLTAISDTAGVTTLLARLTSGRAGNLDNLDAAISSRSTYAGGPVASVTGSVGSVGTSGITASSFAPGAIDAAAIATDAIGAAELSAAAVSKIQTGLGAGLDAAGVRAAVGLSTANLDTQLTGISTKTANLPVSPAPAGDTAGTTTLLSRLTAGRAGNLDRLDAAISSRLAATDYEPGSGGGTGDGSSVRLIQGPLALFSDAVGSDNTIEVATGDVRTLALYLRDGNGEPIPYSAGTLAARLSDTFGNIVNAGIAVTEVEPAYGIAQVTLVLAQRGRFKLTVRRDGGTGDISTFGPLSIHVCGPSAAVYPGPID